MQVTLGVPPPDAGSSSPRDSGRPGGSDDLRELTQEELAEAFVTGDTAHLEEMYRRWGALVLTAAHRALGDLADAEDVVQQVFVSAWRSRSGYAPALGSLPAWLLGITRHRVIDRIRTRERELTLRNRLRSEPERRTSEVAESVDRLVLAEEIRLLPDPRGAILELAFWQGFSYSQIADRLGLPLGTVKSHARRGLLHLRARLEEVTS